MMQLWKSNLALNFKCSGSPEIKFKCPQAMWHLIQYMYRDVLEAIHKQVRR